jgi:glycosyltransferase involved in cell wall biosynthesis
MKKLLYACLSETGGILDYAVYQANALWELANDPVSGGFELHFLCRKSFPVERLPAEIMVWKFEERTELGLQSRGVAAKIARIWRMISNLRSESTQVAKLAVQLTQSNSSLHQSPATRYSEPAEVCVLFDCYKEYFSPLWIWPLRRLAKMGFVIGTIAHDPVRDFVVGPLWWHRWSVSLGYSFVRHVFVHDETPVDFGEKRPEGIEVHQIPFGAYPLSPPRVNREEVRGRFGFADSDIVFFAFGQIRDGKNLDLFLQAMKLLPENVKLLVAGKGHSGSSKAPEFYQILAEELGVLHRCIFDFRRVPEEEVGELFNAIDFTLLTYSKKFRSMSAVLASALTAQKPVLASSGSGPLKSTVEKYGLGVFVKPDDSDEILRGAQILLDSLPALITQNLNARHSMLDACFPPATSDSLPVNTGVLLPAWDQYERENSWAENARVVMDSFYCRKISNINNRAKGGNKT